MAPNAFIDERLHELKEEGYSGTALARFASQLWRSSRASASSRPELRRELAWLRWLGLAASLLVGALTVVAGAPAVPVLVVPAAWWLLLCAWVGVELGLVRHPISGEPSPRIGPANLMTLYRGWVAAPVLVLGLALPGPSPAWVVLCLLGGLTDLLDGTVAVRLHQESRLGRLLDPVLDAFFFSATAVGLAHWGLLPAWLAALVAVRYFLPVVGGLALLFVRGRSLPVRHLPWGQRSTLAIAIALLVTWGSSLVAIPAPILTGIYLLTLLTMALAVLSIIQRAGDSGVSR
jgi:CDP-diacylglycerol--glycerol-3-phosphate 3-phosphatidyltransferase